MIPTKILEYVTKHFEAESDTHKQQIASFISILQELEEELEESLLTHRVKLFPKDEKKLFDLAMQYDNNSLKPHNIKIDVHNKIIALIQNNVELCRYELREMELTTVKVTPQKQSEIAENTALKELVLFEVNENPKYGFLSQYSTIALIQAIFQIEKVVPSYSKEAKFGILASAMSFGLPIDNVHSTIVGFGSKDHEKKYFIMHRGEMLIYQRMFGKRGYSIHTKLFSEEELKALDYCPSKDNLESPIKDAKGTPLMPLEMQNDSFDKFIACAVYEKHHYDICHIQVYYRKNLFETAGVDRKLKGNSIWGEANNNALRLKMVEKTAIRQYLKDYRGEIYLPEHADNYTPHSPAEMQRVNAFDNIDILEAKDICK